MAYMSKRGRRPAEFASKAAHSHVIRDPDVQAFLDQCNLPKPAGQINFDQHQRIAFVPVRDNPIRHVIAIDGGYTIVPVQVEFPSATICFFQFGSLIFSVADLEEIDEQPFIDPDDMAKLKQIQRLKLSIPLQNITLKQQASLTHSVRRAVYNFFCQNIDNETLMETLKWFIFQEYNGGVPSWSLATCPNCGQASIELQRVTMSKQHTFSCPVCSGQILLTDVFRLHEAIDDELGAGGIPGYVTTTIEQIILVHLIRLILKTKPALLEEILFIKDGPLAFFGQTANMHQPMRALVRYLLDQHNLYLAGLEKSGTFVEHADEIAPNLDDGTILLLDNDYIYTYILPGNADPNNPYGRTTYYSNKLIFKSADERVYVASLPMDDIYPFPTAADFHNLAAILTNLEKLKCDMYDSALVPVALVNKLVSLANHPSSKILQRFAVQRMNLWSCKQLSFFKMALKRIV